MSHAVSDEFAFFKNHTFFLANTGALEQHFGSTTVCGRRGHLSGKEESKRHPCLERFNQISCTKKQRVLL